MVVDISVFGVSSVPEVWSGSFYSCLFVNLFRCKRNMNDLVLSLAPKFTRLRTLILRQDKPQLQDEAVETIANYCHDLQELDLSRSFRLTDRSLYALAHGCPNLVKLNISGCSAFSDEALIYLTSYCKKLKCLNLCGCVKAASDSALQVHPSTGFQLSCIIVCIHFNC